MTITLLPSGYFRKFCGGLQEVTVTLSSATATAVDAAAAAGLPEKDVGFILRGGVRLGPDTLLRDRDIISVYPEILGG